MAVAKSSAAAVKPFTVPHFRAWAKTLTLDTGNPWVLEPFQAAFLKDLFHGYVETLLIIPEGNAKTTLTAGIALYSALFGADERIVVAAAAKEQAGWLYDAAEGFIYRSDLGPKKKRVGHAAREEEPNVFRTLPGYREIRVNRSLIKVFAADDRTGDGAIFTKAILEELHRHRDLRLYRTWRGKAEKRGGQLIGISTAGLPGGEFEDLRDEMKRRGKVTTGRHGSFIRAVSQTTCIHDYSVPQQLDPDNMAHVKLANPLKAITPARLKRTHDSPSFQPAHWRRFVCGIAAVIDGLVTPEEWDRLRVDVGGLTDGESVQIAVRTGQEGGCGIGIAAKRGAGVAVAAEQLPYDFRGLELALRGLMDRYDVEAIYVDKRQFGMGADILEAAGLPLMDLPQSPVRLMEATSTFLGLVSSKTLAHDGDPILSAQVKRGTAKETTTGAYLEPTAEIQAFVAVVMAAHETMKVAPTPFIGLPSEGVG